jgi:hypothetical protein
MAGSRHPVRARGAVEKGEEREKREEREGEGEGEGEERKANHEPNQERKGGRKRQAPSRGRRKTPKVVTWHASERQGPGGTLPAVGLSEQPDYRCRRGDGGGGQ